MGPGRVLESGRRCSCPGAQPLHPDRSGGIHRHVPGSWVPGGVARPAAGAGLGGRDKARDRCHPLVPRAVPGL